MFGIPIGIKDIFNTIDFPTEMGSKIWKEFTPGNDARVVYYLKMADALIMGKTETADPSGVYFRKRDLQYLCNRKGLECLSI